MHIRNSLIWTVVLAVFLSSSSYAIQRAARRTSFVEFRGGYAMPQGTHKSLLGSPFWGPADGIYEIDATNVFEDGFDLGISYGQVLSGHWSGSVGFDYARNEVQRPIQQMIGDYPYVVSFAKETVYKRFDLTFAAGYSFIDLAHDSWSPYGGLRATAGLNTATAPGVETLSEFEYGLGLDFGLDFKIWSAPDNRSFMTVSSLNSWNLVSTGERVSHLSIGAGIRYFYK